jgi:putative ABC transport system permease protein
MGFAGGIFGIIIGWMGGKFAGVLVSVFAIAKGIGYIDIASLPILFIVVILALSMVVGLLTGIYPARRAKRISALDALRYE